MGEYLKGILSVLGVIGIFILVLFLAYYMTKVMGRQMGAQGGGTGRIKVIDKLFLGQDRGLFIVQVAGKTLLLGVTAQRIEMLCELNADALPPLEEDKAPGVNFSSVLKGALGNWGIQPGSGRKGDRRD